MAYSTALTSPQHREVLSVKI